MRNRDCRANVCLPCLYDVLHIVLCPRTARHKVKFSSECLSSPFSVSCFYARFAWCFARLVALQFAARVVNTGLLLVNRKLYPHKKLRVVGDKMIFNPILSCIFQCNLTKVYAFWYWISMLRFDTVEHEFILHIKIHLNIKKNYYYVIYL